jgi:two-component system sensor histidine kinase BaeS
MRSLTFKLTLAFLLVSLTVAVLFAVFARSATVKEFDRFALEQVQSDFITNMSAYYQSQGSWTGIGEIFHHIVSVSAFRSLILHKGFHLKSKARWLGLLSPS